MKHITERYVSRLEMMRHSITRHTQDLRSLYPPKDDDELQVARENMKLATELLDAALSEFDIVIEQRRTVV